ncbi:Transmembrane protein 17 [Thoreauomyces humboldtii]|nr:Transmembrane protein 17 [Thoreauomyces humboldtii]
MGFRPEETNPLNALYQKGLVTAAGQLFPPYRQIADAKNGRDTQSAEILSDVILQGMMFLNVWIMLPAWVVAMIGSGASSSPGAAIIILWVVFAFIEAVRLFLGYRGNLLERVPELAGLVLLTVCPQMILAIFFAARTGNGLQIGFNAAYVLLALGPQGAAACFAARRFVKAQTTRFFLAAGGDAMSVPPAAM